MYAYFFIASLSCGIVERIIRNNQQWNFFYLKAVVGPLKLQFSCISSLFLPLLLVGEDRENDARFERKSHGSTGRPFPWSSKGGASFYLSQADTMNTKGKDEKQEEK